MELEIKKEHFTTDNFNVETLLNKCLKNDTESEIFNFKLKIIQREFANEIDLNLGNLVKSSKGIEEDLKNVNLLNENIIKKTNDITKSKIDQKQ